MLYSKFINDKNNKRENNRLDNLMNIRNTPVQIFPVKKKSFIPLLTSHQGIIYSTQTNNVLILNAMRLDLVLIYFSLCKNYVKNEMKLLLNPMLIIIVIIFI